ncbi:hypothetical protein O2V63_08095 [Modestobacter sp. VKM Ac-2977]|uniref:hypothetical protein n=1 Tax=Modestobacter sp. VKM Ac-2977 TaxID=3004131 RepID=UPI0022AB424F|nr:hypothetical protein [Modestobacter sp. VKM Ac-2977]MCZ2820286.1 hypothetical protein [Modestobacter sp. VKM Ac-2977]
MTNAAGGSGTFGRFTVLVSDPAWATVIALAVGLCVLVAATAYGRRRSDDD